MRYLRRIRFHWRTVFTGALLGAFALFAGNSESWALNCRQINDFVGAYLRMHYEIDVFDDVLSRRTLDNFIKALDPGKLYFLEADVQELRDAYGTRLDDLSRASS